MNLLDQTAHITSHHMESEPLSYLFGSVAKVMGLLILAKLLSTVRRNPRPKDHLHGMLGVY